MLRMEGDLSDALEGWQRFDAYRIIGVPRSASLREVRRAFYKRALLWHPDKGGEKEAFQELQRAYDEILRERDAVGKPQNDEEEQFEEQKPKKKKSEEGRP